jgi:hypothetical protein
MAQIAWLRHVMDRCVLSFAGVVLWFRLCFGVGSRRTFLGGNCMLV